MTNPVPRGSGTLNPRASNDARVNFAGVVLLPGVRSALLVAADEFCFSPEATQSLRTAEMSQWAISRPRVFK